MTGEKTPLPEWLTGPEKLTRGLGEGLSSALVANVCIHLEHDIATMTYPVCSIEFGEGWERMAPDKWRGMVDAIASRLESAFALAHEIAPSLLFSPSLEGDDDEDGSALVAISLATTTTFEEHDRLEREWQDRRPAWPLMIFSVFGGG